MMRVAVAAAGQTDLVTFHSGVCVSCVTLAYNASKKKHSEHSQCAKYGQITIDRPTARPLSAISRCRVRTRPQ